MNCPKCLGPLSVIVNPDPYSQYKASGVCHNPKCGGMVIAKDGKTVRVN